MSYQPSVVLVDDHDLVRTGVRGELGDHVRVVGEAGDVAEAVDVIVDGEAEERPRSHFR